VSPPPARLASGNNSWVAHLFNVWRSSEDLQLSSSDNVANSSAWLTGRCMEKQSLKTHVCARSWLITLEVIVLKLIFPKGNTRFWFYFTMEW
jgi:hypothetical protein